MCRIAVWFFSILILLLFLSESSLGDKDIEKLFEVPVRVAIDEPNADIKPPKDSIHESIDDSSKKLPKTLVSQDVWEKANRYGCKKLEDLYRKSSLTK